MAADGIGGNLPPISGDMHVGDPNPQNSLVDRLQEGIKNLVNHLMNGCDSLDVRALDIKSGQFANLIDALNLVEVSTDSSEVRNQSVNLVKCLEDPSLKSITSGTLKDLLNEAIKIANYPHLGEVGLTTGLKKFLSFGYASNEYTISQQMWNGEAVPPGELGALSMLFPEGTSGHDAVVELQHTIDRYKPSESTEDRKYLSGIAHHYLEMIVKNLPS